MITEWKRVSDGQMIACLLCGLAFINKHGWTLELGHVSLRIPLIGVWASPMIIASIFVTSDPITELLIAFVVTF